MVAQAVNDLNTSVADFNAQVEEGIDDVNSGERKER